jgi:hypothetical protein
MGQDKTITIEISSELKEAIDLLVLAYGVTQEEILLMGIRGVQDSYITLSRMRDEKLRNTESFS